MSEEYIYIASSQLLSWKKKKAFSKVSCTQPISLFKILDKKTYMIALFAFCEKMKKSLVYVLTYSASASDMNMYYMN